MPIARNNWWFAAACCLMCALILRAVASPASDARRAARPVMDEYRRSHPACEWCGSTGSPVNRLEVHHIVPCAVAPERASDTTNLITLDRRCHIAVGHCGDTRRYIENVRELIEIRRVRP